MQAPSLSPGQTIGRYRIEGPLGAGGMGEVFRAWDATLRRWVALKVVPRDGTGRAERLLAEARAAAMLKHANLVSVFDVGEADGVAFVSMDLVDGRSLRDFVGDRSVPMDQRILWLQQIASAIAAAHRAGIVHRDVKPENVMIDAQGQARVLDFGLAKFVSVDASGPTEHGTQGPPSFRTHDGRIVGTPAYMAPEQLAGGPPSPSWDQYAFGLLAYELLTGMHPRASGLISADGWAKPLDALAPVPPAVAHAVVCAMAPSSDRRFAKMDAVLAALGGAPSGTSLPPPTPGVAIAGSMPPWPSAPGASSTAATAAQGMAAVGANPTLPTAVHRPQSQAQVAPASPSRSFVPFVLGAGTALVIAGLAVGGVVVWQRRSAAATASASTTASTAAPVVPITTDPSASAPVVASAVSVVVATAATAPPKRAATTSTGASISPSPSASTTAAPPVSAKASSSPVAVKPPPQQQVVIGMRMNPTLQYDRVAIERMVLPMRPLAEQCMQKHPLGGSLPAVVGVGLELWSIGNDMGKVRDVRVHEAPPLAQCLHDVFITLSFGPPKDPKMPPGAVFVSIQVSTP